jgi:hypothetical protein
MLHKMKVLVADQNVPNRFENRCREVRRVAALFSVGTHASRASPRSFSAASFREGGARNTMTGFLHLCRQ